MLFFFFTLISQGMESQPGKFIFFIFVRVVNVFLKVYFSH